MDYRHYKVGDRVRDNQTLREGRITSIDPISEGFIAVTVYYAAYSTYKRYPIDANSIRPVLENISKAIRETIPNRIAGSYTANAQAAMAARNIPGTPATHVKTGTIKSSIDAVRKKVENEPRLETKHDILAVLNALEADSMETSRVMGINLRNVDKARLRAYILQKLPDRSNATVRNVVNDLAAILDESRRTTLGLSTNAPIDGARDLKHYVSESDAAEERLRTLLNKKKNIQTLIESKSWQAQNLMDVWKLVNPSSDFSGLFTGQRLENIIGAAQAAHAGNATPEQARIWREFATLFDRPKVAYSDDVIRAISNLAGALKAGDRQAINLYAERLSRKLMRKGGLIPQLNNELAKLRLTGANIENAISMMAEEFPNRFEYNQVVNTYAGTFDRDFYATDPGNASLFGSSVRNKARQSTIPQRTTKGYSIVAGEWSSYANEKGALIGSSKSPKFVTASRAHGIDSTLEYLSSVMGDISNTVADIIPAQYPENLTKGIVNPTLQWLKVDQYEREFRETRPYEVFRGPWDDIENEWSERRLQGDTIRDIYTRPSWEEAHSTASKKAALIEEAMAYSAGTTKYATVGKVPYRITRKALEGGETKLYGVPTNNVEVLLSKFDVGIVLPQGMDEDVLDNLIGQIDLYKVKQGIAPASEEAVPGLIGLAGQTSKLERWQFRQLGIAGRILGQGVTENNLERAPLITALKEAGFDLTNRNINAEAGDILLALDERLKKYENIGRGFNPRDVVRIELERIAKGKWRISPADQEYKEASELFEVSALEDLRVRSSEAINPAKRIILDIEGKKVLPIQGLSNILGESWGTEGRFRAMMEALGPILGEDNLGLEVVLGRLVSGNAKKKLQEASLLLQRIQETELKIDAAMREAANLTGQALSTHMSKVDKLFAQRSSLEEAINAVRNSINLNLNKTIGLEGTGTLTEQGLLYNGNLYYKNPEEIELGLKDLYTISSTPPPGSLDISRTTEAKFVKLANGAVIPLSDMDMLERLKYFKSEYGTYIDIETNPENQITNIGGVGYSHDRGALNVGEAPNWKNEFGKKVPGYTPNFVTTEKESIEQLTSWLGRENPYVVGHNIQFDFNALISRAQELGFPPEVLASLEKKRLKSIDTMLLAKVYEDLTGNLIPGGYSLENLAKYLGVRAGTWKEEHIGVYDAATTRDIAAELMNRIGALQSRISGQEVTDPFTGKYLFGLEGTSTKGRLFQIHGYDFSDSSTAVLRELDDRGNALDKYVRVTDSTYNLVNRLQGQFHTFETLEEGTKARIEYAQDLAGRRIRRARESTAAGIDEAYRLENLDEIYLRQQRGEDVTKYVGLLDDERLQKQMGYVREAWLDEYNDFHRGFYERLNSLNFTKEQEKEILSNYWSRVDELAPYERLNRRIDTWNRKLSFNIDALGANAESINISSAEAFDADVQRISRRLIGNMSDTEKAVLGLSKEMPPDDLARVSATLWNETIAPALATQRTPLAQKIGDPELLEAIQGGATSLREYALKIGSTPEHLLDIERYNLLTQGEFSNYLQNRRNNLAAQSAQIESIGNEVLENSLRPPLTVPYSNWIAKEFKGKPLSEVPLDRVGRQIFATPDLDDVTRRNIMDYLGWNNVPEEAMDLEGRIIGSLSPGELDKVASDWRNPIELRNLVRSYINRDMGIDPLAIERVTQPSFTKFSGGMYNIVSQAEETAPRVVEWMSDHKLPVAIMAAGAAFAAMRKPNLENVEEKEMPISVKHNDISTKISPKYKSIRISVDGTTEQHISHNDLVESIQTALGAGSNAPIPAQPTVNTQDNRTVFDKNYIDDMATKLAGG